MHSDPVEGDRGGETEQLLAKTLPERAQYLLGFRSYTAATGVRLGLVDYDDAALLLD